MMTVLTITALLIGAVLGLRFTVLILVPIIAIFSATILGAGVANSESLWSILLATITVVTALQFGYLGGAVISFVVARGRVAKDSRVGIATAQWPAH